MSTPEKIRAAVDKYRAAHPERVKASLARWRAENREALKGTVAPAFCECGCGKGTSIIYETDKRGGRTRGERSRFIDGHNGRLLNPGHTVDPETGCWNWNGHIRSNGYPGTMMSRGIPENAHRAYYEKHKGLIPEGLTLDHLCRNRKCVNPDHLEAVTLTVNRRREPRIKLTIESVREIRLARSKGELLRVIAGRYGITRGMVGRIVRNKVWKEQ